MRRGRGIGGDYWRVSECISLEAGQVGWVGTVTSRCRNARDGNIPSERPGRVQDGPCGLGVLLFRLCVTEELPGPVVEGHDGERGLERVGKGAGGAVPLEWAEHAHEQLYEDVASAMV